MMKRVGVIGIIIKKDRSVVKDVQAILTEYGDLILGRMGIPDRANDIYAITLVVEGENEALSALTGKLGRIDNIAVKSAVTSVTIE
ncbi:MAG TPA: CopG family transcriptional regulator [Candidatus Stercoripulliclostridium merdipullorum]|uniref:CopG family transcriptional regulator n=1 Tax=Candidatus Stercoripulliclostridium merdipullorum TaxID=2840952 RepID=A0A9D1NAJ2_9FIRM|nr:CopG family transcriptional regulator [Candidatus Stercoripulliclostridium merdipullorum]